MPDWIETFVIDTEGLRIAESFRTWTGITILAGALERRVWTETGRGLLFPNIFAILCGFPASGKTIAVNEARKHWMSLSPDLHVGPDNPSKAAFLHALEHSSRTYSNGIGAVIFSAMSMPSSELGVLFQNGDDDFFHALTKLYDNEDKFEAPRTTQKSVNIDRPTVNLLGGATPDFLGQTFPEIAWSQGFTSRLIFVYGRELDDNSWDMFEKRTKTTQGMLHGDLRRIFELCGEFSWEPAARDALNKWRQDKLEPIPEHPRLLYYRGRRITHVLKLSMISAVSYHQSLTVTLADFERGRKWLLDAELTMPDVFRAMRAKSDEQLMREAREYLYSMYSGVVREKRVPIADKVLQEFLHERATSDKVPGVIRGMERSDMIRPGPVPGTWVPQPKAGEV